MSLFVKAKDKVFRTLVMTQVKAMIYAIVAVLHGPLGITISSLVFDIIEIYETSFRTVSSANIFLQNIAPPALSTSFPPPGARFENTAQLACCSNLLRRCLSLSSPVTSTPDEPLNPVQRTLIEPYAQSEGEGSRIRSLIQMIVQEFAVGDLRTIAVLSEVLLLAPSLDQEYYRKLLNCVITEVETARLPDLALVQGLVQLVESASSDYLAPGVLLRILTVLSTHLQNHRNQPTKHQHYLIWALSRMLDVMVEGKVKDLRRVDQKSLSALFDQMKASEDPFLKRQATYAFQGLMHVLNDETRRRCTLGYTGRRQVWYTSLREAQQHIHNGRLQTFKNLVFESPCRDHDDFQWGICRLLGNIAIDSLWETRTRKHAVDFLSELYRNNSIWISSECISRWILSILRMIVALEDTAISNHALLRLHGLKKAGDAEKRRLYCYVLADPPSSYPIQARLPIPASSTLLSRVLDIPTVEYDLHRLKDRRLKEQENALYIQPQAKPSLQASDGTLFPLLEKVLEFLAGPGLVFLLLGDSGGGKSTFNLQLERTLWKSYRCGDTIPLHINLPSIDNPQQDMIAKQLGHLGFTDTQIIELKKNREFIVICDGYDESQLTTNIHSSNHFNKPGQWKVKMIVTCRTQYLGSDYRNRFIPQGVSAYDRSAPDLFQEAVIAPFTKEQIQRYVNIYVPLETRTWNTKDYMDKLIAIPNLLDLVRNPFLLSLALEALPEVTKGSYDLTTIEVTRVLLYDVFVQQWLEVNQRRLERNGALSSAHRDTLVQLLDADFVSLSMNYSTKLAQAIFDKQDGNPVVQYVHLNDKSTWKAKFFGSQAEVRLLRDSSPLTRTGNYFRFIHRSMLEYFFSRSIYSPTKNDEEFDPQVGTVLRSPLVLHANNPLFQKDLLQEPSVISFLCDRVKLNPLFKHQLRAVIELSKTDATATIAATNAITILVRAGINFNGADLRGVKVPCADLSGGQFDSAQFQGSDLRGVNFSKSWLRQADMSDAHIGDVRFGELPYLEMDGVVNSFAYSPDGNMLSTGINGVNIDIYNTSTWTRMHRLGGHSARVRSVFFSPDSRRLVSGSKDKTVRLWDTASGEEVLVMKGHSKEVNSVTISPCGTQIASASNDKTVRLWDAHTGETLLVLEDYKSCVLSAKYSPDGCQLVSCTSDGTIQFWDPKSGKAGVRLRLSGKVVSFAYSPDGRWFAVGGYRDCLKLWNAVCSEPGPILSGHTEPITGIDFSLDGQWIASSSLDQKVRLWDTSTGALVAVLTGHNMFANCVAISPDGHQIASAGFDKRVRLWEVGSTRSSLHLRDGGFVRKLAYSCDGRFIYSSGGRSIHSRGIFRQWDATTGTSATISHNLPTQMEVVSSAYALDGSQIAFGYEDGSIRLWNCPTGTAGPVLKGHSRCIQMLVYSPCCRWIASVDKGNIVRLWNLHGVELPHLLIHDKSIGNILAVTFSSTGGQFAIRADEGYIWMFDTQSGERLDWTRFNGHISSLVYSPNGQHIAIGGESKGIFLWNLQRKQPGPTLEGHEDWVLCVAYSPCGQWIASGSHDKTVGIWRRHLSGEEESWSRVHSIRGFSDWIGNVSWNPVVPMELVTSTFDGSVQLWRISVGEGEVVVSKMVWGSNLGILCTEGAVFTKAVGLSPIYEKLLLQRGAIYLSDEPIFPHERNGKKYLEKGRNTVNEES